MLGASRRIVRAQHWGNYFSDALAEAKAQYSGSFKKLRVCLPETGRGVEIQREQHAKCNEEHLGELADTEPDDKQWDQSQVRQRAKRLEQRVERGIEEG